MFCTFMFQGWDVLYTHVPGVRRSMPQSFTKFPEVNETSSQQSFKHLRSLLEFKSVKSGTTVHTSVTERWSHVCTSCLLSACNLYGCSSITLTCLYMSQYSEDQSRCTQQVLSPSSSAALTQPFQALRSLWLSLHLFPSRPAFLQPVFKCIPTVKWECFPPLFV